MPELMMYVSREGKSWPATSADRRLLKRKLATRAGIPYRMSPARVDYLVALCSATGVAVTFVPTSDLSPPPRRSPAPSPNGRHHR